MFLICFASVAGYSGRSISLPALAADLPQTVRDFVSRSVLKRVDRLPRMRSLRSRELLLFVLRQEERIGFIFVREEIHREPAASWQPIPH